MSQAGTDAACVTRTAPGFGAKRIGLALASGVAGLLALFAWVGLRDGWKSPKILERPGVTEAIDGPTLRVAALNLAKLGFHRGGWNFEPRVAVEARMDLVAEALRTTGADVVCLSEIVERGGPVPVDQVRGLAERCGYRYRVYMPNYDFGFPLLRISSGNAILSRRPLRRARGQQLSGRRPFWAPTNNRRALWCEVLVEDRWISMASLRNDSLDPKRNAAQVSELLDQLEGEGALLAGDFNATPDSEPGRLWRAEASLEFPSQGAPTYPASAPSRRIDEVAWPASWKLVEQGVFDCGVSDHLGVFVQLQP